MEYKERIAAYVQKQTRLSDLTRDAIALSVGCSVSQVTRQAGDIIKDKKAELKKIAKSKPVTTAKAANDDKLDKILKRLDSIETKLNKLIADEWIVNTGDVPPDDRAVKVKYFGGKVITAISHELDWITYERELDNREEDLSNHFSLQCRNEAIELAGKLAEQAHPEFKETNFEWSSDWNTSSSDSEEVQAESKRYWSAVRFFREKRDELAYELFMKGVDDYIAENVTLPDRTEHIESYKLVDDSNARVLSAIADLSRRITG